MSRTALVFVALTVTTSFAAAACSSGDVPVGTSSQALQKKKNGGPTGNGQTCSWDDTVSYDVATGQTTTTPSADGGYKVGDTFKSLDGCNSCTCTAQGITCTELACAPGGGGGGGPACTDDAKQCPDGSYVGRTGPACEFAPCGEPKACTEEAKQCPDGTAVGRTGPNCEFAPCPDGGLICTADAFQCPDGSWVSRTGPNCAFAPCP
jgi:hypothetical protein